MSEQRKTEWKTFHLKYEIKEVKLKPKKKWLSPEKTPKLIGLVASGMKTTYPLEIVLQYDMFIEWILQMIEIYDKEKVEEELNKSLNKVERKLKIKFI